MNPLGVNLVSLAKFYEIFYNKSSEQGVFFFFKKTILLLWSEKKKKGVKLRDKPLKKKEKIK